MDRTHPQVDAGLRRASVVDTLRTAAEVVVPMVAQGVIARRPRVVALAEKLQADSRSVRLLQRLRARYGRGPSLLRVPGRSVALVLDPDDVGRVLAGEPEHFAPANLEKRGALSHFQPHGVLASAGPARTDRRRFNEAVLDTGQPVHQLAGSMTATIREEAALVSDSVAAAGVLTWDDFVSGWRRVVRRIVLGDRARDDREISDILTTLRSDANWAYLHPRRDGRARDRWALFPFSGGPGTCPGRELVLFTTSTFLAALLERFELRPTPPARLDPQRPLPRTLDPFTLRFERAPRGG